jgi:hypothetical protein
MTTNSKRTSATLARAYDKGFADTVGDDVDWLLYRRQESPVALLYREGCRAARREAFYESLLSLVNVAPHMERVD